MLYILRHGKTDWNQVRKLQGSTDIPLNAEGRAMAAEAGKANRDLPLDVCYCSPLSRAKETAEIFLAGRQIPVITDERLMEMHFGIYEGMEDVTSQPDCPIWNMFRDPVNYRSCNGAESFESLFERTGKFMEEVIQPELAKGKNILIVGHGAMNASIICRLKKIPLEHFWDQLQANCQLERLI